MNQHNSPVSPHVREPGRRRQRARVMLTIAIALPVTIALWVGLDRLLPPLSGMETAPERLVFALKCICIAVLFCLVTGVEAIAHERLRSSAIDPLAGYETRRMRVNFRYLQNTLEQTVIFIPAVLGLAAYCPDGGAMRAVVATTAVWIFARIAFWVGYHRSSAQRSFGAPGMVLSMLVLLYVSARFGAELAGPAGAIGVVALFGAAEGLLTWGTRPLASEQ